MIELIQAWFQHPWHPGHLIELAFILSPVLGYFMIHLKTWNDSR